MNVHRFGSNSRHLLIKNRISREEHCALVAVIFAYAQANCGPSTVCLSSSFVDRVRVNMGRAMCVRRHQLPIDCWLTLAEYCQFVTKMGCGLTKVTEKDKRRTT